MRPGVFPHRSLLVTLVGILMALPVTASERVSDCSDEPQQLGINACVQRQLQQVERELDVVWQQLKRDVDLQQQRLLLNAQAAWGRYRHAECTFEGSGVAGGSVAPMVHAQCLTRLTRERTQSLLRHLHCDEGDLSCVRPLRP